MIAASDKSTSLSSGGQRLKWVSLGCNQGWFPLESPEDNEFPSLFKVSGGHLYPLACSVLSLYSQQHSNLKDLTPIIFLLF